MRTRVLVTALAVISAPSIAPGPLAAPTRSTVTVAFTQPAFTPAADSDTDDNENRSESDDSEPDDTDTGSAGSDSEAATEPVDSAGAERPTERGAPRRGRIALPRRGDPAPGYSDGGWSSVARPRGPIMALPPTSPPPMPAEAPPGGGSSELARLIENVADADGYRYNARDSAGNGMDTAKVIDNPGGGYLAVYHWANRVKLATSTDLLTWRYRADLDPRATQPTIVATSDGGFVAAFETEGADNGHVKVAHYPDLAALYAGRADRTFTAPRTLSTCNEGTPSITSVRLRPDIDHSVIDLGLHYHHNCDTDREAVARLTNFKQWKAVAATGTDSALVKAAATIGKRIRGNIGDRDTLSFDRRRYSLTEVQYVKGDFSTWQPFLTDSTTGRATPLRIRTHRGSRSFANPTFSLVTAPSGALAIVVTLYVPWQGSAFGEAGELIYYRTLSSPGEALGFPPRSPGDRLVPGRPAPTRRYFEDGW